MSSSRIIAKQGKTYQQQIALSDLGQNNIRIKVLFTGISDNDVKIIEGKLNNRIFGRQVVGKISAVGKNVGSRKVGQNVGIFIRQNEQSFTSGFATYIDIHQSQALYIPDTIKPENVVCLLEQGIIAYKSLIHTSKGQKIAIVGTGHLAYIISQFATKYFNLKVTLFGYQQINGLVQTFGASQFIKLSKQSIQKNDVKFDTVIITQILNKQQAIKVQNLCIRTGKVSFTIDFAYYPPIQVFDLICNQRQLVGVNGNGSFSQYVEMLQIAAFKKIGGNPQIIDAKDIQEGFKQAKTVKGARSIAIRFG